MVDNFPQERVLPNGKDHQSELHIMQGRAYFSLK